MKLSAVHATKALEIHRVNEVESDKVTKPRKEQRIRIDAGSLTLFIQVQHVIPLISALSKCLTPTEWANATKE